MSDSPRERAKALMDAALLTEDGIKVDLTPEEILTIRSACYALRTHDRVFHDGKSVYNNLTIHIEYPGPRLVIRIKRSAMEFRRKAQKSNEPSSDAEPELPGRRHSS